MTKKTQNKYDITELRKDLQIECTLAGEQMKFQTTLGIFSPREIDEGTKLFLDNVDVRIDDTVLDLGCGYGAIGLTLAKKAKNGSVLLVDKDFIAVAYASKNAARNDLLNAKAILSNGLQHIEPNQKFTKIVSNLPAHIGNDMLYLMLTDIKEHLLPGGTLEVVTISRLREWIKRYFIEVFGNYEKVKQGRMHTVSRTIKE